MGQYYNNYPLVLLSGWNGWGEHDDIDAKGYFPYWNFFTSGDLIAHLEEKGFEVYHPSLGPWNSAWDRACILWAYLFGGRVDYGKVHSEKYHHARYGREYPGVLKDLGQEGPHKKISIFGHSFGGPAVKEIANLFVNGSEEERLGTPEDELSPLFVGGHGNLLHSVHTLSGVNNGTSLASMFGKRGSDVFYAVLLGINTVIGDTPLMRGVDLMTQQWGIMPEVEEITGWNWRSPFAKAAEIRNYNRNNGFDNVMHEMQVEVVQTEINPNQKEGDTVYYFAQRAIGTKKARNGFDLPGSRMNPMALVVSPVTTITARVLAPRIQKYVPQTGAEYLAEWGPNDGFVNYMGLSAPIGAPQEEGTWDMDSFQPGIWYNMPVENHDHMAWNGMGMMKKELFRVWDQITDLCRRLPDGESVSK